MRYITVLKVAVLTFRKKDIRQSMCNCMTSSSFEKRTEYLVHCNQCEPKKSPLEKYTTQDNSMNNLKMTYFIKLGKCLEVARNKC